MSLAWPSWSTCQGAPAREVVEEEKGPRWGGSQLHVGMFLGRLLFLSGHGPMAVGVVGCGGGRGLAPGCLPSLPWPLTSKRCELTFLPFLFQVTRGLGSPVA